MAHDPDEPLGPLLIELAPRITHLVRHALRRVDPPLTYAQYRALRGVAHGRSTLTALRQPPTVALSTLSEIVDALVRLDLLARAPSEEDRRAVVLSLTPAGEGVLDDARGRLDALAERLTVEVSPAARAWLAETLAPVNDTAAAVLVEDHGGD